MKRITYSSYKQEAFASVNIVVLNSISNINVKKQIQHITMHVRETCPGQVNIYTFEEFRSGRTFLKFVSLLLLLKSPKENKSQLFFLCLCYGGVHGACS